MKKIVMMTLLLMALAGGARAQYSDLYYHRVGDTIEWKSEIGYYSWWEWQEYYENHLIMNVDRAAILRGSRACLSYLGQDSLIILQRFYTPMPLKIIGIAGVATRGYPVWGSHWQGVEDSIQEYSLIYDAVGDSFPLVAEVPWSALDTMRTLHIRNCPGDAPDTDCCSFYDFEYYLPLLEYYLDSAIYVDDSFYVGGSMFGFHSFAMYYNTNTYYFGGWTTAYEACTDLPPCDADLQSSFYCMPVGVSYKVKGYWGPDDMRHPCSGEWTPPYIGEFYASPWRWMHEPQPTVLMIYPLIEVDTTVPPATACVPVANVQATVEGTTATVTWDGFPNYTALRLRYGFASHPQSVWTEVTLPEGTTMYTLSGLLPTMPYGVTLQAECEKKETEWSAPVTFYTGQDTSTGGQGTEGVEETMLSRLTFLAPNPARDEVSVTSSFSLSRIEIHDLQGVMVFSEPVSGHDVTLPLDFLRSGTYIVSIHTHNGTTHKRLAVAR